ncbi:hypothetical protein Hdeb2414_s0006g00189771 [Helianthus debilis subsp. tardiflorus]
MAKIPSASTTAEIAATTAHRIQARKQLMESEAHKEMKKKMKNDELPLSLIESHILPRLPAKTVGR